jgi:hypothetical protein
MMAHAKKEDARLTTAVETAWRAAGSQFGQGLFSMPDSGSVTSFSASVSPARFH